jgi:mRNA-degrading endonuclease YafQ of YafQ-DinJ toxin-antitoxin module
MRVVELPGFQRGFARLSKSLQEKTWYQLNAFLEHIGSPVKPKSLRLKKLPFGNFEISVNMDLRIIFQLHGDALVLILLGDHEDVRRYLRR